MNAKSGARGARQAAVDSVLGSAGRRRRGRNYTAVDSAHASPESARPRVSITHGDALSAYSKWRTPVVIVSDGPYGLGMFDGDPDGVEGLVEFY